MRDAVIENKLPDNVFDSVYDKCQEMLDCGTDIKDVLACIYEIYHKGLLSEAQESSLYMLADPAEDYNDVQDYFNAFTGSNLLLELIRKSA